MSTIVPIARGQAGGALGLGGAESEEEASPGHLESPDSDLMDKEDGPPGKGGHVSNQKLAVEELKEHLVTSREGIGGILKDIIGNQRGGLQRVYEEAETEKGEEMAGRLITELGCSSGIAKELTVLTLYDVAILIADSDSMIYEENGSRKKTLIKFIDHITEIYSMANESGILAMTFMNRGGGKQNWTGKSQEYLDHHSYGGVTRIGTALKKRILDRFVIGNPNQTKPLLVLIVTDVAAEGERKGHLKNVIRDCVSECESSGKGFNAVTFQFSCIGNDPDAAQLLKDLDRDPDIGRYIDVFLVGSNFERQLEDKWFVLPKVLLGAILPDWDEQDDYSRVEIKDYLADTEKFSGGGNFRIDWEDWE